MKTIALINGNYRPSGAWFAEAASPQMVKAVVNACDDWMTVGSFYADETLRNDITVVPVLTTLVNEADRILLEKRRATVIEGTQPLHTALFDHPHNSRMRNKAGRLCLNGITVRWKEDVPHRPNRVINDWDLKPWADPTTLPRKLMHCPSNKNDEYATFLQRDEATSVAEVNAIIQHLKQANELDQEWEVNLRPWRAPTPGDAGVSVTQAIREHFAVIDGNSVMLLDALREGHHAIVWEHPGKPLAHTLASYAPWTLNYINHPSFLRINRRPLFEFLDNTDVPFEALDNATLKDMITWQMEHLDVP